VAELGANLDTEKSGWPQMDLPWRGMDQGVLLLVFVFATMLGSYLKDIPRLFPKQ